MRGNFRCRAFFHRIDKDESLPEHIQNKHGQEVAVKKRICNCCQSWFLTYAHFHTCLPCKQSEMFSKSKEMVDDYNIFTPEIK